MMARSWLILAGLLAPALAAPPAYAQAEPLETVAARFGARPTVLDVALSPSGNRVAYLSPAEGSTEVLVLLELSGTAEPRILTYLNDQMLQMTGCDWATEDNLVCEIYGITTVEGTLIGFTRMISIPVDGSQAIPLTARDSYRALGIQQDGGSIIALDVPDNHSRILMTRDFIPEFALGSRTASVDEGLGVESVDVTSGRRIVVERADALAMRFVADENGRIRLRLRRGQDNRGLLTDEVQHSYRTADSDRWQTFSADLADFAPLAVDSARNVAYGFAEVDGFDALQSVALDGTEAREVVLARNDVDVDKLLRVGRQRRVVGASYATEKRQQTYFDETFASLARRLQAALPGQPLITIADASADEQKLLIIASSDTDPGMVYLLNRSTSTLDPVIPLRNELEGRAMAPMEPVNFPAADGTMIPAYLTRPVGGQGPMPAVVLPHGGPGARDEWGFDWLVQFLAASGYAVLQPNFRGSAGYGSDWFGRNGFQAWELAVNDVNDAGRWLVGQGIADPERLAVMGWSYGGYAALQSQVVDPELYRAVVAIAPVTDLQDTKEQARAYISSTLVADFVGDGRHVLAGSPARHAERFRAPVLLFHGTNDLNVSVRQSRSMASRLERSDRSVEYIEYDGFDHDLDDATTRADMLTRIGAFLAEHVGP
jgi:dipeptidyl aminopeptidase/acylaminoacyl peptidase